MEYSHHPYFGYLRKKLRLHPCFKYEENYEAFCML